MSYSGTSRLHFRRLAASTSLDAKRPVDALVADAIVNDLHHYADESAQVLAAWSATLTAADASAAGYLSITTPVATTSIVPIISWPVQLRLKPDGSSYLVRVRVGGCSANAAATAVFYVALSAYTQDLVDGVAAAVATPGDHLFKTSGTTSTSAAWLAGTSQGSNAWTTLIQASKSQVQRWTTTGATVTDLGGTNVAYTYVNAMLTVLAQTSNTSYLPKLHGFYAAEYVGS